MQKKLSENYLQLCHSPSKRFASPVLGRKFLKKLVLRGAKISSLSKVPARLWPALDVLP
jgi:hypothetical protein